MSLYTRENSPYYWFEFTYKGERFRGSTECTEKRAAEAVERSERERVKREFAAGKPAPSMTLDVAIGRYWEQVGKTRANSDELFANLERIQDWIGPNTQLKDIDEDLVRELRDRRAGEHRKGNPKLGFVSPSTVNRSFTMILRRVLTRARDVWKIQLDKLNWGELFLDEPEERTRELQIEEEQRLEAVELPEFVTLRRFAQITGFRRRSALIKWSQVSWSTSTITIDLPKAKKKKQLSLPMSTELKELLWPLWLDRDPAIEEVFTYIAKKTRREPRSGRRIVAGERYPITYNGWQSAHKRRCAKAGVTNFRIHDARHTAASRTLRESGNPAVVQKLLGHARITTTMKYAHVLDDDIRRAMDARAAGETRLRAEAIEREKAAAEAKALADAAKITHTATHTDEAPPKKRKRPRSLAG